MTKLTPAYRRYDTRAEYTEAAMTLIAEGYTLEAGVYEESASTRPQVVAFRYYDTDGPTIVLRWNAMTNEPVDCYGEKARVTANRYAASIIDAATQMAKVQAEYAAVVAPRWTITGRTWNAITRKHDRLASMTFERRKDATAFMAVNQGWIAGMTMDRNEAAIKEDEK